MVVDVDDAVPFSYSTPSLYLSVDLVRRVGLVTVHVEREARVDSRLIAEAISPCLRCASDDRKYEE